MTWYGCVSAMVDPVVTVLLLLLHSLSDCFAHILCLTHSCHYLTQETYSTLMSLVWGLLMTYAVVCCCDFSFCCALFMSVLCDIMCVLHYMCVCVVQYNVCVLCNVMCACPLLIACKHHPIPPPPTHTHHQHTQIHTNTHTHTHKYTQTHTHTNTHKHSAPISGVYRHK